MIVNKAFQAPRSISFSDWNNWIFIKNTIFECSELITNYEDRELKCNQLHRLFYLLQDMMSTWRNRGRPPHSAELTFQILEVIYRDFTACQSPRALSVGELQLLYSMVVVRAVNGLVDCNQQGVFASSVLSLAERIGLPAWIVELRHDSTHNQLPSLSVLRSAARYLLTWFRLNYWDPQQARLEERTRCCLVGPAGVAGSMAEFETNLREGSATFLSEVLLPVFLAANTASCEAILRTLPPLKSPISSRATIMTLPVVWRKQASQALRNRLTLPSSEQHAHIQWWRKMEAAQIAYPAFTAALLTRLLLEIQTACSLLESSTAEVILQDRIGEDNQAKEIISKDVAAEGLQLGFESGTEYVDNYTASSTSKRTIDLRSLGRLLLIAEISLHWVETTVGLLSIAFGEDSSTAGSVDIFLKGSLFRKLDGASRGEITGSWIRLLPLHLQICQLSSRNHDGTVQLVGEAIDGIQKVRSLCESLSAIRTTASELHTTANPKAIPVEPIKTKSSHLSRSTSPNLEDLEQWSGNLVTEKLITPSVSKKQKRKLSEMGVKGVRSDQRAVEQTSDQMVRSVGAGIAKVPAPRIWPLGLVPGSLSNRLYLIESRCENDGTV